MRGASRQGSSKPGSSKQRGERSKTDRDTQWIWGAHALEACLENHPELILELQVLQVELKKPRPLKELKRVLDLAEGTGLRVQGVASLPKVLQDKRTQGMAAKIKDFPSQFFSTYKKDFHSLLASTGASYQWAILDGIQDPRNFGAILRSAAAFGVQAIFLRQRNQCPPTGVVAQASAGALFRVPLVYCSNFSEVLGSLKGELCAVFGLEMDGKPLREILKKRGSEHRLWVIGSEGEGIRPSLKEACEELVSIPMAKGVESLNASTAAALVFYEGAQTQ